MPNDDSEPSGSVRFPKLLRWSAKFWIVVSVLILLSFVFTLFAPMIFDRTRKPSVREQELRNTALMIQTVTSVVFGALFLVIGITTLRGIVRGMLPYSIVIILLSVVSIVAQCLTISLNVPILSKPAVSFPALVNCIVAGIVIVFSLFVLLTGIVALCQNKAYKLWRKARIIKTVQEPSTSSPDIEAAAVEPSSTLPVKKTPFPKALKFSSGVWMVTGVLTLIVAVVSVGFVSSKVLEQRQPTDDVLAAFFGACVQGVFSLVIGIVFIHVGQSTRTGKTKDVLGNGVGSVIFGVIHLASFVLLMPEAMRLLSNKLHTGLAVASLVAASLNALFGIFLVFAGMIALAQRQRYQAWRVSTGRAKVKAKAANPRDVRPSRKPSTGTTP